MHSDVLCSVERLAFGVADALLQLQLVLDLFGLSDGIAGHILCYAQEPAMMVMMPWTASLTRTWRMTWPGTPQLLAVATRRGEALDMLRPM